MRPRTKLQFEVIKNSNQLVDRENEILAWAKVHCLDHKGYATKRRVLCMDCGESFSPDLVSRKRAICPHCSTKLKIEQTRKRKDEQRIHVAFAEICGEFQVIRHFEIFAYYKEGLKPRYFIREILQHWVLPNGRREIVARGHNTGASAWCGDLEIRKKTIGSRYYNIPNEVYPQKYHPESVFKKEYRMYGIDHRLQGLTFLKAIKLLPDNPKAETLLKAKQYNLLAYCASYQGRISHRWSSIKICLRNKYKIKDASLWFDYLDLLSYFGKDVRNAHYVCPKDLKKEHDILVIKKRKLIEIENMKEAYIRLLKHFEEFDADNFKFPKNLKQEYQILRNRKKRSDLEKREKELQERDVKFQKFIERFLDIKIKDGSIEIVPLRNIEDFKQEGDALHHCVFTNEYYLKEDSLILSAMVNGVKTETVEVSLKEFKVVQCRGLQNKNTEYHDRIVDLVSKNMRLIRERMKPKRLKNKTISYYNNIAV